MPSNNISQFQMPSNNISQFQMPSSMNSSGHLLTELPNLISEEQAATASSINDNTINATNFMAIRCRKQSMQQISWP
uniref:Putative ovule protein n=1 Tax=Solanum chacoense TaxID=4108 RepID=A0A0V0GMM5_SOLCH